MKKNVISEKAYDILISKSPAERSKFLSNAIIIYNNYLNHTLETISEAEKAEVKEALYELIKDGEVTLDTFKRAIYDLDNVDAREEEINWYVDHFKA